MVVIRWLKIAPKRSYPAPGMGESVADRGNPGEEARAAEDGMTDSEPPLRRGLLAAGLFGMSALAPRTIARAAAPLAGSDAGGVTVTFPGASAAITLSEVLKERCSLRSFGAKLDGTTDDSPAVARAVGFARANNVPVFHPGGPCLMAGAAAEIDTAGVAFAGIGMGDFNYPYGHTGSQFWLTDTAKSP